MLFKMHLYKTNIVSYIAELIYYGLGNLIMIKLTYIQFHYYSHPLRYFINEVINNISSSYTLYTKPFRDSPKMAQREIVLSLSFYCHTFMRRIAKCAVINEWADEK